MKIEYIDRRSGALMTENPPAEGMLKFMYGNPLGQWGILPLAKRKFISEWYGRKMDKPESVNDIQTFVDSLNIDMDESLLKIDEFSTFNDFFYRELKPEARPIGAGFVSPGDGRLLAFESLDAVNDFFVKGRRFTLKEFLGNQKQAERFANSAMLILRLAPNDYHRFHFPYAGTPSKTKEIKGHYYSVSPHALVSHFAKVFCENKREYCILKTEEKGDVLLAPVGATMVGGIVETYRPDQEVEKGDEMGYFAFGGSTIVILMDKDKLTIDADILENSRNKLETYVRMGEKIAS